MIRQKVARSSVAAVTVLAASGALLLTHTESASAAALDCSGPIFTDERVCIAPVYANAPLFTPSNQLWMILSAGTKVRVTCWYYGSSAGYSSDGFEDHVTHEDVSGTIIGHIPDDYVNFGGDFPDGDAVALPQCG
jgi:hypothetical protein